jgi:hypothetical protein
MLYHSKYLGYTALSYIGSSVTSGLSDIPQQLTSLGNAVFGKIMAISQRLQRLRAQRGSAAVRLLGL